MSLLPLRKLLKVPLNSIVLVVDNARSPENPLSFFRSCLRSPQKRPGSWDDTTRRTSATPVRIPIRQDSRNRIHQKNESFRFAAISTNGQTGDKLTRSSPLRKPIRQLSRQFIHKESLEDYLPQAMTTGTSLRKPIRQLSRESIHKENLEDYPPQAMTTKNTMLNLFVKSTPKIVGIVNHPPRVPVRQSSLKTIRQKSLENQSKRDMTTVDCLTKALQVEVYGGDGY
jgi:hypothetical protein